VVQDASARQAEADNDHHDNVAAVDATRKLNDDAEQSQKS